MRRRSRIFLQIARTTYKRNIVHLKIIKYAYPNERRRKNTPGTKMVGLLLSGCGEVWFMAGLGRSIVLDG